MTRIEHHVVREIVALDETATLADATRLMASRGIGSVGVRRDGRLVGLVTDGEIIAAISRGAEPARDVLGTTLDPRRPTVTLEATDRECAALMREHHTRHLAVADRGQVIGVISMLDVVEMVVEDELWAIDQLEAYIRGGRAEQLSRPLERPFSHPSAETRATA
jgi:CBS domain-containing protein